MGFWKSKNAGCQACGVVHVKGHTMGFPVYDLTAMVHQFGRDHCRGQVENRKQAYIDKIIYWKQHDKDYVEAWADFMLK